MSNPLSNLTFHSPTLYEIDNSDFINLLERTIINNNEQNRLAQQASIELSSAINALDLNEQDQYIKNDLYNELETMTNNVLQSYGGNIKYAMQDISNMSKKIISDPNIAGRIDSNRRHREYIENIKSRDDINDDVKQMIIEKNPYTFTPIYKKDNDGNDTNEIETYKRWEPSKYAVEQMDYNTMIRTGLSYISPNAGSNETIIYYKKDDTGKMIITNDPSEAKFYSINGRGYQEITTADVELSLIQAYVANPKFAASLNQDYELAKWKAEKGNDVYGYKNLDGTIKTKEEFMLDKFKYIGELYSYKHENITKKLQKMPSDTKYGSFSEYLKIRGLENTSNYQGVEEVNVDLSGYTDIQMQEDDIIAGYIEYLDSLNNSQ